MPEISRFLGIIIYMNWREHNPPHIHAKYGEFAITVEINSLIVEGRFPKRALSHVIEWVELHKDELLAEWSLAQAGKQLYPINPLE